MESNTILHKEILRLQAVGAQVIFAVTGLPASGKAFFGSIAERFGFRSVVMGDIVRNECISRGLEPTRENCNKIMVDLRKEFGKEVIAKRCVNAVQNLISAGQNFVIIDGIRSLNEIDYFRKYFPQLEIVAIHASPRRRFERMLKRLREDDGSTELDFKRRDDIELSVGIGDVIAKADYMLTSPNTLADAETLYLSFLETKMSESNGA